MIKVNQIQIWKQKWSFTTFNCRLGYNDSTVSNVVVVVSSDTIYVLFLFLHHIDQVLTWLFFLEVIGIWLGLMEWNEIEDILYFRCAWLENWFENVSQGTILRKIRGNSQESFLGIRGKELSFCHKLWFSNLYIFVTQCRRP